MLEDRNDFSSAILTIDYSFDDCRVCRCIAGSACGCYASSIYKYIAVKLCRRMQKGGFTRDLCFSWVPNTFNWVVVMTMQAPENARVDMFAGSLLTKFEREMCQSW